MKLKCVKDRSNEIYNSRKNFKKHKEEVGETAADKETEEEPAPVPLVTQRGSSLHW